MAFIVFLLLSVLIKWFKDNESERCRMCHILCLKTDYVFGGITTNDSMIVSRLTQFSLVFLLLWMVPLVNQFGRMMDGRDGHLALVAVSHWSISLIGTANCVIWSRSKNFKSFMTSYQDLREMDDEMQKHTIFDILHKTDNI
eukprot:CAMPEP_0197074784 /NCGR_PEP_ID=MMETSP1384-20130603/211283_1 /TAXON_ID=29189 /ORGANISM="Ammonia sp." /LENGTH=141 /DNA_ID=CAMNT_0042513625 /DNA_START=531 /DNA_END=956 /DNA_ORIENTATION=-